MRSSSKVDDDVQVTSYNKTENNEETLNEHSLLKYALQYAAEVKTYFLLISDPEGLDIMCKVKMKLDDSGDNKVKKQTRLTDFFKISVSAVLEV